ncbi:PilZ domain-containing protein [Arsukibacterium sp.]|uniref:PilZ domain-containing protein n=1 Tax=Arsukibacterium sp. TaxID=1977258 RepID=UPI00299D6636|nr:PilZ domain-containing protein [Arsukibacterium sp.]MDX1676934.1 PilZ domain-containing protein [Arsukibacterium sp.]
MEQRRFSRVSFQSAAHLETTTQSYPAEVLDLSLKGALISIPQGWQPDVTEPLLLRIHLTGYPIDVRMQVSVTHQHDDVIGLHCDKIDLESAGHLKRLIELNLGDSQLLSRELSELSANDQS